MADETFDGPLFDDADDSTPEPDFPRTQPEGVRIIGAHEAGAHVTGSVRAVGGAASNGSAAPIDPAAADEAASAQRDDEFPTFGSGDLDVDAATEAVSGAIPVQEVAEVPVVEPGQSFEMPHYSEPPTGQVPKVVIGEETEASWSSLGDQPRWRDADHQFDEEVLFDDLEDSSPRLGALAGESEHRSIFADLDLTDDQVPTLLPEAPAPTGVAPATAPAPTGAIDDLGADVVAGSAAGSAAASSAGPRRPTRRPARSGRSDVGERAETAPAAAGPAPSEAAAPDDTAARRPPAPRRRRPPAPGGDDQRGPANPPPGGRNVPVAAAVGVGLLALGGACFWAGALPTTLLVAAILVLCTGELLDALRHAGYRPARLLALVGVAGLAIAPLYEGYFAYPVVLGLTAIVGLAWFLFVQPGEGAVMNLGVTLLTIFWIGGLGSFASLALGVARVVETDTTSNQGIGVVVAAVLVAVSYDVGAFFVGRWLGRTPLNAASPNKTQEGLLGGVAAAIFVPFLILFFGKWDPVYGDAKTIIAFCLICAVIAPLGDLCESAIKRDLGVKDMGSMLPGHGGILDRFDGILFVLPAAYFMAHLLEIGSPAVF